MENQKPLSFADIISSSVANLRSGSLITLSDVFLALFASLVCAAIISYTYKKSYQGVLYQKSFNLSLILIALITTAVIMVISGNLVLSLGMVGALSIIRFRSAVKDPIDIVFMFWAVSIGIANGVAAFKVSFVSTIVIALLIMISLMISSCESRLPAMKLNLRIRTISSRQAFSGWVLGSTQL